MKTLTVQHQFGDSLLAMVFLNILQFDSFSFFIGSDICCLLFGGNTFLPLAGTFLLNFQPGVNIIGK